MPKLNIKKPYAEMHGEPGVSYLQDGNFFDRTGVFIRESGIPKPVIKPTVDRQEEHDRMERHLESLKRTSMMLGQINRVKPQPLMEEIERENRRAFAAEHRSI